MNERFDLSFSFFFFIFYTLVRRVTVDHSEKCSFYRKSFKYSVVTKIENQNSLVHRVSNSKILKMYMVHDALGSNRYRILQFGGEIKNFAMIGSSWQCFL